MVSVRATLLVAILLALAPACGGGEAFPPPREGTVIAIVRTIIPTPVPTATPTPEPTPSPTPAPASLDLSASVARQGGFLLIRLISPPPELLGADVTFNGASYRMLAEGDHWYRLIGLPTDIAPGDYPVEVVAGGASLASASINIGPGGFQYESIELPPSSIGLLSDQAAIDAERSTLDQIYSEFTPQRLWDGTWRLPADGFITNAFGLMRSINGGPYFPHSGTDIANDKGTPVYASAAGRVALARSMYLYGNVVVIDHGAGVFTSYNHLEGIVATEGALVSAGELIGYMGETGFVNGPHVHWEAIIGGVRTDPMIWTQAPVQP